MIQRFVKHTLAAVCLLVFLAITCVAQTEVNDGLRIEFPEGGHLRVENQFGAVSAEVWQERYVMVSATVEGGTKLTRSPVVIENRKQLVVINIVRLPSDPAAVIGLSVKIPASSHVEIVAGKYPVTMRGTPKSASIRSGQGNISVEVAEADVDITARSLKGSVKSQLPQLLSEGHVLQARVGTGAQTLRLTADSGNITLVPTGLRRDEAKSLRPDTSPTEVQGPAAGIPAPASDAQEISEGDIIRVDSQLVALNMSVIDRNTNRGLVGLDKSDFKLYENGVEQNILQFESSAAPFDLFLLIDISGSTRDVLSLIRAAAQRFVDAARPQDRIGVIAFAGDANVVSPLTLDRAALRQRIKGMETATGSTKLYDATEFAVKQAVEGNKNRRTAIIIMSDGLDGNIEGVQGDGSRLAYKDILSQVQEFDGVLYALWLNTEYESLSPLDTQPEAFDTGHDRMKEMADVGGGLFYEVERLQDLAGAYERVVADLGTVYSLAYRPIDKTRDGKWRAIRVSVDRPAAAARGKRGYYAN